MSVCESMGTGLWPIMMSLRFRKQLTRFVVGQIMRSALFMTSTLVL